MDNKDKSDISFSDVIDSFLEDTVRAEEILKDLHLEQSQEEPSGLSRPFADTSQLPGEDKAIVQKYLENRTQQELSRDRPTEQTSSSYAALDCPLHHHRFFRCRIQSIS